MKKIKKLLNLVLCSILLVSALSTVGHAKTGDVIGYAKYTDIAAYINHYPITSYNINDYTVVVAEDLQNYGFDVEWNGTDRTLSIKRNKWYEIKPSGQVYKYSSKLGQNSYPYLETDIVTYVNGQKVDSFNIGGKTCIYLDALSSYGEVVWVPEIRALKLWINALPMKEYEPLQEYNDSATYKANANISTTIATPSKSVLTREQIEVKVKPDAATMFFENKSQYPYTFSTIVVNDRIVSDFYDFGKEVTVNPGETKLVTCKYSAINNSTKKNELGLNSYGYVVVYWQGEQYYMDFTVNGITTFYKGNARGPAN